MRATGATCSAVEPDAQGPFAVNLQDASGALRNFAFRASRVLLGLIDGGRISAFGKEPGRIGLVLILNLDRQPRRLRRTLRELSRFRSFDGVPLVSLARRLAAVDARDGRAVAATADVDPNYLMGDQLFVQPDARLEECFGVEEPIRMTRQEVAVARSHIEAWKVIASGSDDSVLVLEDDIWFTRRAAVAIDQGWRAQADRTGSGEKSGLLYLSYADAGGTAERSDACSAVFRPVRGLWFLSGYVLTREGAKTLLRSMPVVGPVDLWMNFRFADLGALALSSPAILQRPDGGSDNRYSVMPYLARAGIVDANAVDVPRRSAAGPVLAWTGGDDRDSLAMALSMLGLRVRAFDGNEALIGKDDLSNILETYDSLIDAPLSPAALTAAIAEPRFRFVLETGSPFGRGTDRARLPSSRTAALSNDSGGGGSWQPLCTLLNLTIPSQDYPNGPPRGWRIFRDDRRPSTFIPDNGPLGRTLMDVSPWALLPEGDWPQPSRTIPASNDIGPHLLDASMATATPLFPGLVETFPGNLATFERTGLSHGVEGAELILSKSTGGTRQYRSGAFASARAFGHGRFEAEIRPARGAGLVTGFFLHRDAPRQEIDVEFTGDDPHRMLANVFFNPGDDGANVGFGYRGSPCRVDLGFDATAEFHLYGIDWRPGRISWLVDGRIVHERVGWDPTPIPHLPMRLHANLWAPRSLELAGRIDEDALPSMARFRSVSIWAD